MSREMPTRPLVRRLIVFTLQLRQTGRRTCQSGWNAMQDLRAPAASEGVKVLE